MKILNYIIVNDFTFIGVFTGTASILWYSFVILRLGCIIKYLLNLSNQYIKKIQQYFQVFRIFIMLFMLLKFIWEYDLFIYCFYIITVILLGFVFFRHRRHFASIAFAGLIIESNKVTIIPERNMRFISKFQRSEFKLEVNLSEDQIHIINEEFGAQMVNNTITGDPAITIIQTHLVPIIKSSGMDSLILEILNHF